LDHRERCTKKTPQLTGVLREIAPKMSLYVQVDISMVIGFLERLMLAICKNRPSAYFWVTESADVFIAYVKLRQKMPMFSGFSFANSEKRNST
jgi:hypothetical protein